MMYEIVPGFIAASLAIWLVSKMTASVPEDRLVLFGQAAEAARAGR